MPTRIDGLTRQPTRRLSSARTPGTPSRRPVRRKISGTGRGIRILTSARMPAERDPGREVLVSGSLVALRSSEPDFDNVEAVDIDFSEHTASRGVQRGHSVITHPGGEKTFIVYEGTSRTIAPAGGGIRTTFEGDWWYTGGTGKFTGIIGGGTYSGRVTPSGPDYSYEGEYVLGEPRSRAMWSA